MEGVIPFSNGTQYLDWQESNCRSCRKAAASDVSQWDDMPCEIERELSLACALDGRIPLTIWNRMGHDNGRYVWPCMEHDPPFKNVRPDGEVDPAVKRPAPAGPAAGGPAGPGPAAAGPPPGPPAGADRRA